MTVSPYGVRGGRSPCQSKKGLITTPFIMCDAESSSLVESGSPNVYEKSDWSQSISPLVALAYGSSRSFDGLQRAPFSGSYGPWTRKPYCCPGPMLGRYACQT